MTPHPSAAALAAYPQGSLGPAEARTVEQHVDGCRDCRRNVTAAVSPQRLDALWAEVVDAVDAPRATPLERSLARAGVPADRARLLALMPSMRASWVMAMAITTLVALAGDGRGVGVLAVAPLIPLLGVHLAYGTAVDGTSELTAATPRSGFALLLQRTLLVLAASLTAVAAVGALTPAPALRAGSWLLPSLALCASALALSRWVPAAPAFAGTATAWVALVTLPIVLGHGDQAVATLAGQLLAAAVAVAAGVLVVAHAGAADSVRTTWNRRRAG